MKRQMEAEASNLTKSTVLAASCRIASTFGSRFLGLMGKVSLPEGSALLLKPCSSVHMMFMRFKLDLVFLDHGNHVIRVMTAVKPWTVTPFIPKSAAVIELPEGKVLRSGTQVGDFIVFRIKNSA